MKQIPKRTTRARVWATRSRRGWTWHYEVLIDGRRVLYDNTGAWNPILWDAVARVSTLRHLHVAHTDLVIPECRA